MRIAKSQISKKVLAWAIVFSLVLTFTPTIEATHEDDDTINVENAVFPWEDDGISNDLLFFAHDSEDEISNITINVWKKNTLGNWEEYDNGQTNEDGELEFLNVTAGEYMWDAYDGNNKIQYEGGYAVVDTLYSVGHVGMIEAWDDDDNFDDFIAYVFEGNSTSDEGYVKIYDEDGDLVDEGYTDEEVDEDWTIFLASNLDRGNYTHYIYEEYNGTLIHNGSFHSYGSYNTTSDDDSDEWFESWDYETEDTNGDDIANEINVIFDPDTDCNCSLEVNVYMDVYNNDTGNYVEWEYGNYTITGTEDDEFSMEWTAREDGNFTFYFNLYDDDWNWEDQFEVYEYLECDANNTDCESNNGNGTEDSDEWFEDMDYYVDPSDTINIEYDPNTDCYCEVRVWVYIDVYQDGNKIDTIADDYYIYYTDYDWFEQSWTAYENDTYDFKVVLFDGENGPDNYEDEIWIYNVYLGSGDNGTGGDGDGEYGIGHVGQIDDVDGDGFVNDYIGAVTEEDEFRTEAYFEIYSIGGELVDSGIAEDGVFISSNLPGDDYVQYIYYEEGGDKLQASVFYSYGNSSGNTSTVINVDMAVLEDEEEEGEPNLFCEDGPCDDAFFKAHRGHWENGISNVTIEICTYENDTGECEHYDTVYTNETGEAASYDGSCATYEWTASYEDNEIDSGIYEIWACGDDEDDHDDHGDNETEDYDEKFSSWDYYGTYDENDEHQWNKVIIGYNPDTDCDCEMDVYVEVIIWDEDGNYVDYSGENHTINNGYSDWFEIGLEVDEPGKYWFTVDLYDDNWTHEDQFNFSLIMSDEWFIDQFSQDGSSVRINLDPQTNYGGEIGTEYYFDVLRLNESNDDWEYIDGDYTNAVITSSDNEDINFEWTAEEEGTYRFMVYMYDEHWNMENMVQFETEIVMNHAPVIHGINTQQIFEGQMFTFEVDVTDKDGDNLEFKWDMGDGTLGGGPWGLHDESIMYVYPDDGEYVISVHVSDGNGGRAEENFTILVINVDPTLQISYDDFGQEGQALSFNSQASDVPEDTVTVTWSFPDGTQVEGNFAQYLFVDDGEFLIRVTAEDEDGGLTSESLKVTIENVAPIFTTLERPTQAQEGENLDFVFEATDPGDDTIVFHIDFGDGTAPMITQDGNVSHKYAEGSDFVVIVCAKDEDGGETCRDVPISVDLLEQLEEEGLLPGFNLLLALSALGVVGMLRRRTH